ncbi:uncharacterized protein K452DRAFT_26427 [Aplosporella prunicola CBS 121167]|uniref:Uncharacterized protein n=1 Tax=Aplosporella prunicola CBS 121167 TaxID=1176127 RepID=A0A6A6BD38_9PEZI|nr:uncharacterized protein K452DRAFT_26427 [Aplosporella prunicola CBS 121167]KAF2142089.1 hypothetical protein K452DRAFT_26427 [Aplosporella prunicola CBS 121167]
MVALLRPFLLFFFFSQRGFHVGAQWVVETRQFGFSLPSHRWGVIVILFHITLIVFITFPSLPFPSLPFLPFIFSSSTLFTEHNAFRFSGTTSYGLMELASMYE